MADDSTSEGMMPEQTLTIALPPAIHAALADVARSEGRPIESVAVDAIAEHVASSFELRARILRGTADIAAGRVVPHEEVMADLHRIIDDYERKQAP